MLQSLTRGVTSIWFFAHVTGWWGKMCMFRDWRFCWVLSIAFEILELALQFVIPDFQECWCVAKAVGAFDQHCLRFFIYFSGLIYII